MSPEYDWLFDARLPLLAVKHDKAPVHTNWPSKVLDSLPNSAVGVAIKLGGSTGFVDIEGDGLDAENTWDVLTTGLAVPIDYMWASSRGNHRLVHLPRDLAKTFDLSGVVKIGDLEIRIGDIDAYTHYSVLPTMGGRKWLSYDFDFRPRAVPVELWARISEFVRAGASGRVDWGPSDQNAQSPGTIFNQAATWEEVLEPHGWKKLRLRGDITDWTRPGKTDLTLSATTGYTGDKLYVFSTNAEPFEANRAYDKFGAFALLNFDGDLSAAATDLARQGYVPALDAEDLFSDTIVASDGEIISEQVDSFVGTEDGETSSDANGELYVPVDELCVPGLVEKVARYHVSRAHRVNPRAGAVAGIILQSILLSRRVALFDGTRPNVAILMGGGSGVGKTEAVDTLKIILGELGLSELIIDQVKSQQGLEDALAQSPIAVYAPEESQDLLMSMFMDGSGGSFAGVVSAIKRFFTASRSSFRVRAGAGGEKTTIVKYPHLGVWMTGIPQKIWDNIGTDMLDDGFLARLWNIELSPCPLREDAPLPKGDAMLLAEILAHCRAWLNVMPETVEEPKEPERQGEWVETVAEPLLVPRSPEAEKLAAQFAAKAERIRADADETRPVEAALWARAYISVCKLELICAGSRTAHEPVVREADTARAIRVVEAMLRATMKRLEMRAGGLDERQFRKKVERVRLWMERKLAKGHGSVFTRDELGEGLRLRIDELRSILLAGQEWGVFATDAKVSMDGTKFATQFSKVKLRQGKSSEVVDEG